MNDVIGGLDHKNISPMGKNRSYALPMAGLSCAADARPTLRERKRIATLRRIEDVATLLFLDRGFEGATLDLIAERAGVHKQTLLRYFPTKEDLAFAGRRRLYAEFVEGLPRRSIGVIEHWRRHICDAVSAALGRGGLRQWFAFVDSDLRLTSYNLQIDKKYQEALAYELSRETGADACTDYFSRARAGLLAFGAYEVIRASVAAGDERNIIRSIDGLVNMTIALEPPPLREPCPPPPLQWAASGASAFDRGLGVAI
jgi:AcrR family transcriptional regulator